MPNILPLLEEEAGNVYNKGALGTLRAGQDADNALAAQLAAGSDAPLTQQPFANALSSLKIPPKDADAASNLSVDLSKSADNLGDSIPSSGSTINLDPNQDVTGSVSPAVLRSKMDQLKAAAPYAGAAGAGVGLAALQGAGGNPPSAQSVGQPQNYKVSMDPLQVDVSGASKGMPASEGSQSASTSDNDEADSSDAKMPAATPNIASVQKMQEMQQRANQAQGLINAARGATTGMYAMMGKTSPFDKDYEAQSAQAGQLPAQYEQLVNFQKQDPKSAISQTYQQMAKQIGMPISDQTSASEIEKAFPQIVNLKTREDMIAARREYAQDRIQEMHFRNQQMSLSKELMVGQKQQGAFDNTVKLLEQMRGSPAVSQAEKDIYAADKAMEIQKLAPGGDLNQLNPQMVQTLVQEIGKIASGTGSTQAELQALTPATLRSRFAGVWQELANHPTPANAGAFLKQYMQYADGIKSQAQKVITDRYGRVIGTVGSHLSPDQNALLQEQYINRFTNPMPGQGNNSIQQAPQAPAAPQGAQPQGSQQAPQSDSVMIKTSDGQMLKIPSKNLDAAKKRDPNLQVLQ